jgi:hypothetical protein
MMKINNNSKPKNFREKESVYNEEETATNQ